MSGVKDGTGALALPEALAAVNQAMLGEPIGYTRLRRAAAAGEIPARLEGCHWLVQPSDVSAIAAYFTGRNNGRAARRAMRVAA